MSRAMPGDDGFGATKGWDRAPIANRSSKPYHPDVRPGDLLLPNEASTLRALGMCAGCALGMTFLYVFLPLMALSIFVSLGVWFGVALGIGFLGLSVLLFRVSERETRKLRELALDL